MSDQILASLRRRLDDIPVSGPLGAETQRNVIKEELQYYILNFVYHHPEYSKWTMYGGSALRICHGLDRMSVDLDFEVGHAISDAFLDTLQSEVESHFEKTHALKSDQLTIKKTNGRGLKLRFLISHALNISHHSNQIHVKIDLNRFVAPKPMVERIPINREQMSFVIRTYNMSALMASKIAAIFLRGQRGVGKATYGEKGRDIYDLLWYMKKSIVPDLSYLAAKGVDAKNPQAIFDRLTLQMNQVSDINLRQDLTPLFLNGTYIENWLGNWRESYLRLLEEYRIRTISSLKTILIRQDFYTDVYFFEYVYVSEEGVTVRFVVALSDYWVEFNDGRLPLKAQEEVVRLVQFPADGYNSQSATKEKLYQYATLFYQKIEQYLQKTDRTVLGDLIATKLIRMTADDLDQREQILLNKSALLSCELNDLLR